MSMPNRELRFVEPQNLRSVWEQVKEGLREVKKHSTDDWIEEDIYHAIKSGSSFLYLAFDREYVGFVILTIIPTYASKVLHVWCAYSCVNYSVVGLFAPEIEKIAKSVNASKLTFHSPRRGWEKYYQAVKTIYEKEIT